MTAPLPPDWVLPDWPAPAAVRAACSVRTGGVSAAPYDSLNLGDHVGDAPEAVAVNRRRFAEALGARPVFLRQVHGTGVVDLRAASGDDALADACWTRERGIACTIMVADCLPLLLADRDGTCVAAAHAGWRGLAGVDGQGVFESLWTQWWPQLAATPAEAARRTLAWLGPCIGPQAFEVGDEVRAAFTAADARAAERFRPRGPGKWMADLPGLARDRLQAIGLPAIAGNDGSQPWCTASNPSRFFSHRRDRTSGRFAASIWLA